MYGEKGLTSTKVEYTAPRTPQQNAMVERPFAFLFNRIRALLNREGVSGKERSRIWEECANADRQLDNIHVREEGKSSCEKYHGHCRKYEKS